jgi:Arc/MetJ-type ribon-helix-helix transcriptional regulator
LTDADLAALDRAIAAGQFAGRSAALREGVAYLLREEREREIVESYRRGYGRYPQEEWIGEYGLAALAAWHEAGGAP